MIKSLIAFALMMHLSIVSTADKTLLSNLTQLIHNILRQFIRQIDRTPVAKQVFDLAGAGNSSHEVSLPEQPRQRQSADIDSLALSHRPHFLH